MPLKSCFKTQSSGEIQLSLKSVGVLPLFSVETVLQLIILSPLPPPTNLIISSWMYSSTELYRLLCGVWNSENQVSLIEVPEYGEKWTAWASTASNVVASLLWFVIALCPWYK